MSPAFDPKRTSSSREFKRDHVCAIPGGKLQNVMTVTESSWPVLASKCVRKRGPEHGLIFRGMAMIRKAAGRNDMSKRILVVDDQPDNRQIIRDMLALTD